MRFRIIRDSLSRYACGFLAASVPLFLAAVLLIVVASAWPAIMFNGWHFLYTLPWSVGNEYGSATMTVNGFLAPKGAEYGMLVFFVGTLLTSLIALIIAVPVSIAAALFLSEVAPRRIAGPLGTLVELLAGVPSVVFGLWGIEVVAPAVKNSIGPVLSHLFGFIPAFRGPVGTGVGLLSSGIVLAIMIIPIITAVSRDVIENLPDEVRHQGYALGATRSEVIGAIILPYARNGIIGAITLGLGRALGETMAVLMVSGSALNYLPGNIYSPVGTMAANIVALLDSAMIDPTGMAVHALAELALVLFILTFIVNALVPIVAGGVVRISSMLPTAAEFGGHRE